ncbi:MAG: ATP-binding protein [Alphaproteobacteria bacterium]|nr:ATP-binding protein [Alphaproteobacteria bacterium]
MDPLIHSFQRAYGIALVLMAGLAVVALALVEFEIRTEEEYSESIEAIRQQQFLTQHATLLAAQILHPGDDTERQSAEQELTEIADRLAEARLRFLAQPLSPELRTLYSAPPITIEPRLRAFIELIRQPEAWHDEESQDPIPRLLLEASRLAEDFGPLLEQAEFEAEQRDDGYHILHRVSVAVTFLALIWIWQLIFKPVVSRADDAVKSTKTAETRLQTAVEGFSAGFTLFDAKGRLVACNQRFTDLHGPAAKSIVPGASFAEIMRECAACGIYRDAKGDPEAWLADLVSNHRDPTGNLEQELADGRWLLISEHRSDDGAVVGIWTDITQIKQSEERSRLAKEAADLANRSKSEFLANMSHELRTPLNAIIGFSEIMVERAFGDLPPPYDEYAGNIHYSGKLLLSLITDILDLSKIEAGKQKLNEDLLDINALVQSCERLVRVRAGMERIDLSASVAPDLPALLADERAVKQILLNLLNNGIKFTPAGGAVSVQAHLDPDGNMRLQVTDTGPGIPAAELEQVFAPFGQGGETITREKEGTGLGLTIVKALTELHGGRITLQSAVGEGTTATVTFPADRVARSVPGDAGDGEVAAPSEAKLSTDSAA